MFSRNSATEFGRAYAWRTFIRLKLSQFKYSCSQCLGLYQSMLGTILYQVGTNACTRVFTAAGDRYREVSQYYCVVFRRSVLLLNGGYYSADTFGLPLNRDSIRGSALQICSVLHVFRVSILLLRVHFCACVVGLPYCSYSRYTLSSWAFSVLAICWPPVLQYFQDSDYELFLSIFYSVSVNFVFPPERQKTYW